LILLGGALHLLLLIAAIQVPRMLDWKTHFERLPKFLCTLFWVYAAFVVLTFTGFGILSLLFFEELAEGTPLARGMSGFIALFWIARLVVQFWFFDASDMLSTRLHRAGYHALTVIFILLTLIYGWAALQPGNTV
jgi:hypothetical protein